MQQVGVFLSSHTEEKSWPLLPYFPLRRKKLSKKFFFSKEKIRNLDFYSEKRDLNSFGPVNFKWNFPTENFWQIPQLPRNGDYIIIVRISCFTKKRVEHMLVCISLSVLCILRTRLLRFPPLYCNIVVFIIMFSKVKVFFSGNKDAGTFFLSLFEKKLKVTRIIAFSGKSRNRLLKSNNSIGNTTVIFYIYLSLIFRFSKMKKDVKDCRCWKLTPTFQRENSWKESSFLKSTKKRVMLYYNPLLKLSCFKTNLVIHTHVELFCVLLRSRPLSRKERSVVVTAVEVK